MMPAELQARLEPPEIEDTESLREETVKAVQAVTASKADAPDARDTKVWTFNFSYKDGRGKVWAGDFTNKILSIGEQQQVAILEAKLCGGLAYGAVDPTMRSINHAIAHMTFSLSDPPDWAKDLRKLDDPMLVISIYEEVASHESRFFGLEEA